MKSFEKFWLINYNYIKCS